MDNETLQRMTETISEEYFHKKFRHQARFNNRLKTTGGRYLLKSHDIEINPKQYEAYGEAALIDIIKHELVHYHLHIEGKGYQHRDHDFKKLSEETGAPRFCNQLPIEMNPPKYIYVCRKCGHKYARKRKVNTRKYRCSQCHGTLKETLYRNIENLETK